MLKTTRNLKANKIAAKITKGGVYYLADSVVVKGGSRDIATQNPKATDWARSNDTGDILSLIDFEYIKESNGSFAVSTVSQLASVVYYVNTTPDAVPWIFLMNDFDLSGYKWVPMGWKNSNDFSHEYNYEFKGMIEGWDHTISNLHIDVEGNNVGFLGYAPNAGVRDLNITNASVTGELEVGIMTGNASCGYYHNCYVQGKVNGDYAGSMIGSDSVSEYRNCTADVTVNGKKYDFLTAEKKQPSKAAIKEYIKITKDKNDTFRCPKVTNYDNLSWTIFHDGHYVRDIDAKENQNIRLNMDETGYYKIYLSTFMDGQYVRVSNIIKVTVNK